MKKSAKWRYKKASRWKTDKTGSLTVWKIAKNQNNTGGDEHLCICIVTTELKNYWTWNIKIFNGTLHEQKKIINVLKENNTKYLEQIKGNQLKEIKWMIVEGGNEKEQTGKL